MPPRAEHQAGFTLLEVLVAFVVLALVLGVILRIHSQGLERVGESDLQTRAVMLAESKLALLGADIPLEEGETQGEAEGGLAWTLRLSSYEPEQEEPQAAAAEGMITLPPVEAVQLLRVEVVVSWGGKGPPAEGIRLTTLRLAPRKPA